MYLDEPHFGRVVEKHGDHLVFAGETYTLPAHTKVIRVPHRFSVEADDGQPITPFGDFWMTPLVDGREIVLLDLPKPEK